MALTAFYDTKWNGPSYLPVGAGAGIRSEVGVVNVEQAGARRVPDAHAPWLLLLCATEQPQNLCIFS